MIRITWHLPEINLEALNNSFYIIIVTISKIVVSIFCYRFIVNSYWIPSFVRQGLVRKTTTGYRATISLKSQDIASLLASLEMFHFNTAHLNYYFIINGFSVQQNGSVN